MYIYLDKQGVVKEIINDEALRQSASNVNEIYVYYDGLQEADIGSVLATYGLPDGTITDEMQVATQTQESEIPYNAERDLKYFKYYQAYPFYHFAIADLALSQEGVVRLMVRLAQKDGEYIKVAGLICFDVEGELVKEDHGVSLAQYNYLVKAWYETKECLPLDGSKAMQGNLDMGAHNVLLNGKTLKDNNGALNYNGSDLAKQSDTSSLQSQIDTINATQNVVDIVGTKAELNDYATKDLHANDKIEVLADESQNNANTIYEWNGNAWLLVGSKAPYYSKAESDARYNELKAKSYDKDTTSYVTGHVPDSSLVSRSLDGISENLETTKIQVATNKNNIETLQGNYTGLQYQVNTNSSDIALTKTQVETNKANIAKNTQDITTNAQRIENLSAVTPTDINVDSNYNLILEHNGKEITGQKKKTNLVFSYEKLYGELNKYSIVSVLFDRGDNSTYVKGNLKLWYSGFTSSYSDVTLELRSTRSHSLGYKYSQLIVSEDFNQVEFIAGDEAVAKKYKIFFRLAPLTSSPSLYMPLKGGTFALVEDLATKQSTLYRHTVKISKPTDDGNTSITFTTSSEKNTPIGSIQDLTTVFGNTDLSVSGATFLISSSQWEFYNKIHVGVSINDTTVDYINKDDVGTYNFIDMFGTTGFTITDNVTAM